jgi:PAS domain S-box-containing protein
MDPLKLTDDEVFSYVEKTPDLVCIADREGYFKKINQSVVDTLGYTREELFTSPISSFIYEEDKKLTSRKRAKLLKGEALVNFENRYVTKAGELVWLHWTSIYLPEKQVVLAIAKNITAKKQSELEIEEKYKKFKSLAHHFKESLEKDRKYLAIELHEELAQLASVVKMDIDWINEHSPCLPKETQDRIDHALAVSDVLINAMRRISFSISPTMLEDLGLHDTMEWLCNEFSILNGIPCFYESRYDESLLSYETQLDFYRICQEALNNIMNHAAASLVKISLEQVGDEVCLSISDDGVGFNPEQKKISPGLTNIQERVTSMNGRLHIRSTKGNGTCVCVTITNGLGP